jgi:thioredoxin-related protein
MGSKVKVAKIDATKHNKFAQKYQVKGFPTLLFFGKNNKNTPIPYNS